MFLWLLHLPLISQVGTGSGGAVDSQNVSVPSEAGAGRGTFLALQFTYDQHFLSVLLVAEAPTAVPTHLVPLHHFQQRSHRMGTLRVGASEGHAEGVTYHNRKCCA